MLTKFDDYAIHQTAEPVAHPSSGDRNVYDRYWFNGYADDGEFYFGVGMGLYPNRSVLDCGFSIVRDGEQHSFHGSRRAPNDPSDTNVGPFRLEIVEPMRRVRIVLEPNETGIECDLTFTARTACIEEGRQRAAPVGRRNMLDMTRFAQNGRWQGEIKYDGKTVAVDAARVFGTKDRSWGVRPVGEPEVGAPPVTMPQFFFLWAPLNFRDHCTHFGIFEDENGTPWHQDGAIVPAYDSPDDIPGVEDPAIRKMATISHRLTYVPGTRRTSSAELTLREPSGKEHEISLESLICFQMKGIGYTHPEWGHGRWKGELAIGGESWKSADLDPLAFDNLHTQQVVRARWNGEDGVGALEQICFGPHGPSGLTSLIDGAA